MRYYDIFIPDAPGVFPRTPNGAIWSSHPFGGSQADPGAQQIEFQIEEYRPNLPSAESVLTVHGVAFSQIRQFADLVGKSITVYGGMKPGLPLATAQSKHAGLLLQGRIVRCWGNWIGTEMSIGMAFLPAGVSLGGGGGVAPGSPSSGVGASTGGSESAGAQSVRLRRSSGFRSIDFRPFARGQVARFNGTSVVRATDPPPTVSPRDIGGGSIGMFGGLAASSFSGGETNSLFGGGIPGLQAPLNIIHNMLPNIPLSSAIRETLSKAFPSAGINVLISGALKLPYQDAGMYQNLPQYSKYVQNLSQSILGIKNYVGVNMSSKDNTINVWDGTTPVGGGGTIDITALELIGQPTWVKPQEISVKTVLRSDIVVGSYITLPPTLVGVTQDASLPGAPASEQRTVTSFAGTFLVNRVLHIGDFRNPDGAGWSSNYEAIVQGATTGQNEASQQVEESNQQQNPDNQPPATSDQPSGAQ